jgi:D-alanyl-D-alanine-carboxypeptidase/D-alanyl-D-alanine-endopeptidase
MKIYPLIKWGLLAVGLFSAFLAAAFIALLVYVLHAQRAYAAMPDTHDLTKQVSDMGADYMVDHTNAELVIAVYQHGKVSFQGFGKVSDANQNTPDENTIFEIGSVTKIFTATLLAEMVDDGTVKLDDPISLYLPAGVTSPKKNGHEITLENLATHTSGLPRLPDNLLPNAKDPQNPYADYTTQKLYDSLATVRLASEPGSKSVYSNYGFGLLGKILALKVGKPYEELIEENICAPLELKDTTISLSAEQKARLAPGHSPDGSVVPNWDFDALAGCGAMRSDAADLIKLVRANLSESDSRVSRALNETHENHFQTMSGGIGLGWQISRTVEGQSLLWHNGGTGGYVSFVGFDKENEIGVVILSSYGDAFVGDTSVDKMGMKILRTGSKASLE